MDVVDQVLIPFVGTVIGAIKAMSWQAWTIIGGLLLLRGYYYIRRKWNGYGRRG